MLGDYLSESQADTLVQQLQQDTPINRSHGSKPAQVTPYEFSKDKPKSGQASGLHPLERLHQTMLPEVRTALFELTRQRPTVTLESLPPTIFMDCKTAWSEPCFLYHLRMDPLGVPMVVALEGALASGLVDLIFGGDGAPLKRGKRKTFSQSEAQVGGKFMERLFAVVQASWLELMPMNLTRQRMETQPQFANFLPDTTVMSGFRFSVAMGDGHAGVALWFPDHELQSLTHTLFPTALAGAESKDGVWGHQIRRKLEGAQVELSAEFAEFQLSIAELISLQRGDIIPIGKPKDITAKVGDRAVFSCGFGVSQGRHAIRIEQKLMDFSSLSDLQGTDNSNNQQLSGDQNG